MKVLIAEDDQDTAQMYRYALESAGHEATITPDGKDCLRTYLESARKQPKKGGQPFDAVVLDYRITGMDGMQVAKEILGANPGQRIIFASAYVKETLMDSVKQLKQIVELVQKPFEPNVLVETIEDVGTLDELKNLKASAKKMTDGGGPTSEQLQELLEMLKKIQKSSNLEK